MRNAYLETLYELAQHDKNVYAIISDNGAIVYDEYRRDFPDQYINAGIAEANMVGMAAGMASRGKIPFAYTIGAFLAYRAYEFILNDVCLQNQNVKLIGIGAGCSYSLLGSSHHTLYDLAVLNPLPNLTIISPASPLEVKKAVRIAYELKGPVYIRLGTNRECEVYDKDYDFYLGRAVELRSGNDITIISTGSIVSEVLQVADILIERGVTVRVLNMHTIKPFDHKAVIRAVKETKAIITVEEHSVIGGLGSIVSDIIAESGISVNFKKIGIGDFFIKDYGKHDQLKAIIGLSVENILNIVLKII